MAKDLIVGRGQGDLRFKIPDDNTGACVTEDLHFCYHPDSDSFKLVKRRVTLTYKECAKLRDWLNERLKGSRYEERDDQQLTNEVDKEGESEIDEIDSPASKLKPVWENLFNKIFCAPKEMPREEVQREIDRYHPSGTSCGWQLCYQKDNPTQCEDDETKQHWLCQC